MSKSLKELETLLASKKSMTSTDNPIKNFSSVDILSANNYDIYKDTLEGVNLQRLTGASGYFHGVLAPNGCIYVPPAYSDATGGILKINTLTSAFSFVSTGGLYGWASGVLHSDGFIYFLPLSNDKILKFDPLTDTFTTYATVSSNKFLGGVIFNNKIYCSPYNSTVSNSFGIIDPSTGYSEVTGVTKIGTTFSFGSDSYRGSVLGYNNLIYFFPNGTNRKILELNPITMEVIDYEIPISIVTGLMMPNGKICLIPGEEQANLYYFDIKDKTLQKLDLIIPRLIDGGILDINGNIVASSMGNDIVIISLELEASLCKSYSTMPSVLGGVPIMGLNGEIYCVPSAKTNGASSPVIRINPPRPCKTNWALSPIVNHY